MQVSASALREEASRQVGKNPHKSNTKVDNCGNGLAAVENSLAVPQKFKNRITI